MRCTSVLVLLNLLLHFTTYGQKLLIRAVYYSETDEPYLIEEKYQAENNREVIYYLHDNTKSYMLLQHTTFKGLNWELREQSYRFVEPYSVYPLLDVSDSTAISINSKDSTATVSFYYLNKLLGDTTVSIKNRGDINTAISLWAKERVPKLLKGEIVVDMDSQLLQEMKEVYFDKNIPTGFDYYDRDYNWINAQRCSQQGNSLVCNSYRMNPYSKLYQIDSIAWNADTTELVWYQNQIDWNKEYETYYKMHGDSVTYWGNNQPKRTTVYLQNEDKLKNLLISDMVYQDELMELKLPRFERQKILQFFGPGWTTFEHKYTYNEHGQISEQTTYVQNKLTRTIRYYYY